MNKIGPLTIDNETFVENVYTSSKKQSGSKYSFIKNLS